MPVEVMLTYDGSYSSIHAIKMYSYLFLEWRHVSTCLLSIFENGKGQPDHKEHIRD